MQIPIMVFLLSASTVSSWCFSFPPRNWYILLLVSTVFWNL